MKFKMSIVEKAKDAATFTVKITNWHHFINRYAKYG